MGFTITFEVINEEGCDEEHTIPAKYMVCPNCGGSGKTTNPAIDSHGISAEEWNGPDWSGEDKEFYLNGGYDITCVLCKGKNVVLGVDEKACSVELLLKYQQHVKEMKEDAIEQSWEREMGY